MASSDLTEITGFWKNKVLEILETLIQQGYAEKIGSGRGTKYRTK